MRKQNCEDSLGRLKDKKSSLGKRRKESLLELVAEESKTVQWSYIGDLHTF